MTGGGAIGDGATGSRRRDAGFTLLEVLVALVVLGFVLTGVTGGIRYGVRASQTQARLVEAQGELDAVDRALRRSTRSRPRGRIFRRATRTTRLRSRP